jgi:hypothetical protein
MNTKLDTTISTLRIVGWREEPMYDEHPSLATYTVQAYKTLALGPQTLGAAKALIQPKYLLDAWYGVDGYSHPESFEDENWPGRGMTRLELIDEFDCLVAEAVVDFNGNVTWADPPSLTEEQIAEIERQAKTLYSQATVESGWDNFSTAANLREEAASLLRKVSTVRRLASPAF